MSHLTAWVFALAFVFGSLAAQACPMHEQTASTPSSVATADQAGPSTKIDVPADG